MWCLFKDASAPENSLAPHWFVHFQHRDLPLIPQRARTPPHAKQILLVVSNSTGFRSSKQTHQEYDVVQGRPRKLRNLGGELRAEWVDPALVEQFLMLSAFPVFVIGRLAVIGLGKLGVSQVS